MMPQLYKIEPTKTYATHANAVKAVEKHFAKCEDPEVQNLRYSVMIHTDGRFFPVFIGVKWLQFGIHFHFNVIG